MALVHILKGRNSISLYICRGRDIPKGRRHYVKKKTLFCLCFFMFVFMFDLWCFELSLVSMLCCSHCIVFVCWTYILPYDIVFHWMHVQMIICFAMWSLLSFPYDCHVFNQVAHMFHNMSTFHNMFTWSLFTCYTILVFYYLLYLEGLICFVQVFQVTGIYVPSSSQLLWFMIWGVIW